MEGAPGLAQQEYAHDQEPARGEKHPGTLGQADADPSQQEYEVGQPAAGDADPEGKLQPAPAGPADDQRKTQDGGSGRTAAEAQQARVSMHGGQLADQAEGSVLVLRARGAGARVTLHASRGVQHRADSGESQ